MFKANLNIRKCINNDCKSLKREYKGIESLI